MGLPKAYLTSTRNLGAILNAIKTAKAPQKFTQRFLESLEFKSVADRLVIGVLKALKFLNDDGAPTQRYFEFLDQSQSERVLADGIRDAFSDLFEVNINAQTLTKSDLINKFRTLSQGQLSDSVMDKMALTFTELCKLADFSATAPAKTDSQSSSDKERVDEVEIRKAGSDGQKGRIKVEGLVYNIQLILPESRDQAVYDALFRSLREHLG